MDDITPATEIKTSLRILVGALKDAAGYYSAFALQLRNASVEQLRALVSDDDDAGAPSMEIVLMSGRLNTAELDRAFQMTSEALLVRARELFSKPQN